MLSATLPPASTIGQLESSAMAGSEYDKVGPGVTALDLSADGEQRSVCAEQFGSKAAQLSGQVFQDGSVGDCSRGSAASSSDQHMHSALQQCLLPRCNISQQPLASNQHCASEGRPALPPQGAARVAAHCQRPNELEAQHASPEIGETAPGDSPGSASSSAAAELSLHTSLASLSVGQSLEEYDAFVRPLTAGDGLGTPSCSCSECTVQDGRPEYHRCQATADGSMRQYVSAQAGCESELLKETHTLSAWSGSCSEADTSDASEAEAEAAWGDETEPGQSARQKAYPAVSKSVYQWQQRCYTPHDEQSIANSHAADEQGWPGWGTCFFLIVHCSSHTIYPFCHKQFSFIQL